VTSPWDFPGNSTGVDCHFLLQGIFPTQGSNPGLPHCRQMLYHLSHQGSPPLEKSCTMVRKPLACLSEECSLFAQNESSRSICNRLIGVYTGIGSPDSAEAAPGKLMIHLGRGSPRQTHDSQYPSVMSPAHLCLLQALFRSPHIFSSFIISKTTHCHLLVVPPSKL